MEEVGVAEQFLLAPHDFFTANGNRIQHGVAHFLGQLFGPLLDNGVTRVGFAVDGVPEAHDFFFALQHAHQASFGFFRSLELLDQLHGRFVGTAVQRATQGTDGAGYAAVDVRQRGGTHPRSEGRRVEFVLGVQNQGNVHHLLVQLAGLLAVQQLQEHTTDGIAFGVGGVDTHTFVGEAVPVSDDGREGGQHAVDLVVLLAEVLLGFQVTQHGATGAHNVHGVGVFGNLLQHQFQGIRQGAQALEPGLVGVQLGLGRQFATQQQVSHFFKLGVVRQVADIIAAVGQAGTGFANGTQGGFASHLATQACST